MVPVLLEVGQDEAGERGMNEINKCIDNFFKSEHAVRRCLGSVRVYRRVRRGESVWMVFPRT